MPFVVNLGVAPTEITKLKNSLILLSEKMQAVPFIDRDGAQEQVAKIYYKMYGKFALIVFPDLQLTQNTVLNPMDELHAWLDELLTKNGIILVVKGITKISSEEASAYQAIPLAQVTLRPGITTNKKKLEYTYVIPGIQLIVNRRKASPPAHQLEVFAHANQFINITRGKFSFRSQLGVEVNFKNAYLHSYNANGFVVVLPCNVHKVREHNSLLDTFNQLLTRINLSLYYIAFINIKDSNCFNQIFEPCNNSNFLDFLAEECDDVPENYKCALSGYVMDHPVGLPNTDSIVDRKSIDISLMLNPRNPFNRQPLTSEQLIPKEDLKKEIEEFIYKKAVIRLYRANDYFVENKYEWALEEYLSIETFFR